MKGRVGFFRQHATASWLLLFIPPIVLYYWRILLTDQFSLLTTREGVNQAYSWLRFWIYSVRHWTLPIWDPYSFAGRSFPSEMQTAAFYPLHLVLALFPLNDHHVLSPYLYNAWWAGAHVLGAWFMFLLVREFGLSRFAAFVAGPASCWAVLWAHWDGRTCSKAPSGCRRLFCSFCAQRAPPIHGRSC